MPALKNALLSEEQKAQFRRDGYLIMRGFFNTRETDEIRSVFMKMNENGPIPGMSEIRADYSPNDPLSFYPRMMHPHRHPEYPVGSLSMQKMLDSRIRAILCELMEEEPVAVQSMFYFKPPGARGQDLHQDNYYLRVKPKTCVAAWLAVDDADSENGGMIVVPGSGEMKVACPERSDSTKFFTNDHVNVPEGLQEMPVTLYAGDMLFFNGSVIHGSYPNTSKDRFRRAFICHYIPMSSAEASHWYRPMYDFDGKEVMIAEATGGGPCGTPQAEKGPH